MYNTARLLFIFVGFFCVDGQTNWFLQSWKPIVPVLSDQPRGFDFQGPVLSYTPRAFASESHIRNQAVYANPFGASFTSPAIQPANHGNIQSFKVVSKQVNPTYASKYTPLYKQNYNHKYIIPKNVPYVNNQNAYNPTVTIIRKNPKYLPTYKPYKPYESINTKLHGYYNDPYFQKLQHDVNENEKRLKEKERPPQPHDESNEGKQTSDEEVQSKFDKNEQNENFQPEFEPYNPLKYPQYYNAPNQQTIPYDAINSRLKYPRKNVENIKYHPLAYAPLKNKINELKSTQGKTFGKGQNDYPENRPVKSDDEIPDGHDIFDRQQSDFDSQRANFQSNFDDFTQTHHPNSALPVTHYEKPTEDDESNTNTNDDDFIPIKMYAQVRHTETVKHLPKEAASDEAVTYDDVINAPRLREAIKTTKSQTVYTEEGYEDNAYDHAGHQKHASNHEGHGGYVKNKHEAAGKYTDHGGHKYEDGGRTLHGEDNVKNKKWLLDEGDSEEFDNRHTYSEKEGEHESKTKSDLVEAGSEKKGIKNLSFSKKLPQKLKGKVSKLIMTADTEQTMVKDTNDGVLVNTKSKHLSVNNEPNSIGEKHKYVRLRPNYYWKRLKKPENQSNVIVEPEQNITKNLSNNTKSFKEKILSAYKRTKREDNFLSQFLNLDKVVLSNAEILKISKEKLKKPPPDLRHLKYPYYNMKSLRDSPLRYAENIANIPRKSPGGSEFYDSRSSVECSEVESDIDPIPDRIKNRTPESDDEESEDEDRRRKRFIPIKVLKRKRRDNFEQNAQQPRLRGLGDKIDCFKDKYFGSNPLDSPFFDEDVIAPPTPINTPFSFIVPYKKVKSFDSQPFTSILQPVTTPYTNVKSIYSNSNQISNAPLEKSQFSLLTGETVTKNENNQISIPTTAINKYVSAESPQASVYSDVMDNIKANLDDNDNGKPIVIKPSYIPVRSSAKHRIVESRPTVVYQSTYNKENIRIPEKQIRITRDNHFTYEPYKIIDHTVRTKKHYPTSFSLRPSLMKKSKRIGIVAQASTTVETKVDVNGQPIKQINDKVYINIGRKQRKTTDDVVELIKVDDPILKSIEDLLKHEKNEEKTTDVVEDDVIVDSRQEEPKYEASEEVHKNHKKYYSPVSTKTSITPEELNVEYLLKSKEDSEHKISEVKNENDEVLEKLLIDDIAAKVTLENNTNIQNEPNDKSESNKNNRSRDFIKVRPSPTIFDVSAYLPKPIVYNNFSPRHNYSSRYTSNAESTPVDTADSKILPTENSDEIVDDTENIEENVSTEASIIRHTVETTAKPVEYLNEQTTPVHEIIVSTTPTPSRTTTHYYIRSREKIKSTEAPINIQTPQKPKKRRRIKLPSTTSTASPITEYQYYERPVARKVSKTRTVQNKLTTTEKPYLTTSHHYDDTDNYQNPELYDTTTEIISEKVETTKDDMSDTEKAIEQWKKVLYYENTPERTTPNEDVIVTQPTKRARRPTHRQRDQYSVNNSPEDHERAPRKPRILEKTSKKRKTTVITNSKRYDNAASPELQAERRSPKSSPNNRNYVKRKENPTTTTTTAKTLDYNDDDTVRDDDDEELEIKETSRIVTPKKQYDEDNMPIRNSQDSESEKEEIIEMKNEKLMQSPVNEEIRYQEDVEEEEVIQERTSPSSMFSSKPYDYYRDPHLANKVNRLTDAKKEDQHPIHSDVEIFKSDFDMIRGPKHGGNYKKFPGSKPTKKRSEKLTELEDLGEGDPHEEPLHGGNYRKAREDIGEAVEDHGISARILRSFAALVPTPTTTPKPKFEKNPGNRLYYFLKV